MAESASQNEMGVNRLGKTPSDQRPRVTTSGLSPEQAKAIQ
jgi:hypothetical protein